MEDPKTFSRHTDSVLCCAIDSRSRLAVSGGIDDTAFVWDLNTNHVIFECSGHKESVNAASFSLNSTYVATGDLSGYIQVRNTITGIRVFDYDIDEINWILWHNKSEYVLLAGTTKGDIWMWNVNDPAAIKNFTSYGSSCTTAKLLNDGLNIVVGYQDGALRSFDLKTSRTIAKIAEPKSAEIISLDVNANESLLAIGCIDSSVKIFTIGTMKSITTFLCKSDKKVIDVKPPSDEDNRDETMDQGASSLEQVEVLDYYTNPEGDTIEDGEGDDEEVEEDSDEEGPSMDDESVESVLFSRCSNYLAVSNNSGTITIWDVPSNALRCERHTGVGITRCAWTDASQYITGCLDGTIRVYDINLNAISQIAAHTDQVLDIAYREKMIVTASEDKTCRVIKLID